MREVWTAWVYIVANRRNGAIYIGMTTDLPQRIFQHRAGRIAGFTQKYGCKILVWFQGFETIIDARAFEHRMKKWNRAWKLARIEALNPQWRDLYSELASLA
ncbi:MAG: GIY-YIG nuclease family protein [Croceibacterium sp.]